MENKRTKGRQKIAIEKIERENDCFATFSKRRVGLFKKASELSTLCHVDIGVLVFSPTGKPFSFFHPSMESVMTRFHDPNHQPDDPARLLEAYTRTRVLQLSEMIEKVREQLDAEKEREKLFDDLRLRRWWDEPIGEMEMEQVDHLRGLLQNLQSYLNTHPHKSA